MEKRYHGQSCKCFFCLAWDSEQQKPNKNQSATIPIISAAIDAMNENCKYHPKRRCEKCGRLMPIDTSPSVYSCTMGSGCADYSKDMARDNDWMCDCKDSAIRWVDEKRPHVAIAREGWFCMGCLSEFIQHNNSFTPENGG